VSANAAASKSTFSTRLGRPLSKLSWHGLGPGETYVDRRAAARVGVYHGSVSDQLHRYLRPQESGNKLAVRWLSLDHDGQYEPPENFVDAPFVGSSKDEPAAPAPAVAPGRRLRATFGGGRPGGMRGSSAAAWAPPRARWRKPWYFTVRTMVPWNGKQREGK
jgi:hypothetical protein